VGDNMMVKVRYTSGNSLVNSFYVEFFVCVVILVILGQGGGLVSCADMIAPQKSSFC